MAFSLSSKGNKSSNITFYLSNYIVGYPKKAFADLIKILFPWALRKLSWDVWPGLLRPKKKRLYHWHILAQIFYEIAKVGQSAIEHM